MLTKIEGATSKELLKVRPEELQKHILETLGVKTAVKREWNFMLIMCQHHSSCFMIMERLRFDFDYSVHKRGKQYLIEIKA